MKDDNIMVLIKAALEKFGVGTVSKIVTRKKEENTILFRKSALDKFLNTFTLEELELLEYKAKQEEYIESQE